MAQNLDSKVRAKVWLTPDQVDDLRSACYSTGADYLQQRNEAIIALMYDTGLRVGELVAVDVDMLREGNTALEDLVGFKSVTDNGPYCWHTVF